MPDPRLTWREPVGADAEELARMLFRCWVDTYTDLLPPGWFDGRGPEHQVSVWQRVLAEPAPAGVRRTAVFDGGSPVAWCVAGPGREHEGVPPVRELALWGLYVARAHLGTGLGQALLEWALADRPAELWVARGNTRALAFYARNRFAADGAVVEDPRVPLTEVRLVR